MYQHLNHSSLTLSQFIYQTLKSCTLMYIKLLYDSSSQLVTCCDSITMTMIQIYSALEGTHPTGGCMTPEKQRTQDNSYSITNKRYREQVAFEAHLETERDVLQGQRERDERIPETGHSYLKILSLQEWLDTISDIIVKQTTVLTHADQRDL